MKVVYHWWGFGSCISKSVPVILSIATLRSVNPKIEIKVVDISDKQNDDWLYFQNKLNFEVVKINGKFRDSNHKFWRLFSRIPDVYNNNKQGTTIYCDSDVFWLRDPLPLYKNPNKFCFNIWNAGFFYYNKTEEVEKIFSIYERYILATMKDEKFCETIKYVINKNLKEEKVKSITEIYDETVLYYLYLTHRELFNVINTEEHCNINTIYQTNNPKMFHCNGFKLFNNVTKEKRCPAICCIMFEELYKNMCDTIGQNEIDMFFNKEELDYYIKKQTPLKELNNFNKNYNLIKNF